MILQRLVDYYNRQAANTDSKFAQDGFQKQPIHFIIRLDNAGNFKELFDTCTIDGKKKIARTFDVPRITKKTSNIAANLLWDKVGYVLGVDTKGKPERAVKQKEAFLRRILQTFPEPRDEGINAIINFYRLGEDAAVQQHPLFDELKESNGNLSFSLLGENRLICERPAVKQAILAKTESGIDASNLTRCLITGEVDEVVRLHTAIKGVNGAKPAGANIVSFNLPAFNSYGKEQGANAPIGKKTEFAYTTALNSLLAKGSRQSLTIGESTTMVFWAAQQHKVEDWLLTLMGGEANEPITDNSDVIRALYAAPKQGAIPIDDDPTPFYLLGLAPNAARLAIRFWHETTVKRLATNIRRYFKDIQILHGSKDPEYPTLLRLLSETAVQGKAENIPPNLVGETMKAILSGSKYPYMLLATTLARTRASRNVSYHQAAVIKAFLVRNLNLKEVGVSLDNNNTNVGYLMGRLFAVLERAQELAKPGINATIRDRFYGSAATTPGTVFPYLLRLKVHHTAKLASNSETKGMAINLEKLIGEIMEGLTGFPSHLSLPDQGCFAVGYYHQRQSFFIKKGKGNEDLADKDQTPQL